jgi:hypothetical protein
VLWTQATWRGARHLPVARLLLVKSEPLEAYGTRDLVGETWELKL